MLRERRGSQGVDRRNADDKELQDLVHLTGDTDPWQTPLKVELKTVMFHKEAGNSCSAGILLTL